ncbi:MAG: thiamine phosphate synthase [bacterium]
MSECSLYLVSPPKIELPKFLNLLEEAFEAGGVKAFQLRLKEADDATIIESAQAISKICQKYEAAFIINDRPDLVAVCNADGVHLGQDDMDAKEARKIIGKEKIIGVSCHASRDMAFEACEKSADYVAFGAFFPTKSKPQEKIDKWGVPEIELIEFWSNYTNVPCVAIGGMKPENCESLVKAGADFIGAITAVWENPEGISDAVGKFNKIIKK